MRSTDLQSRRYGKQAVANFRAYRTLVYDGGSRSVGARAGGVGLQTFRDWVLRFNAKGPSGLVDGKAPGLRDLIGPGSDMAQFA